MNGNPSSRENEAAIRATIEAIPSAMRRMGWTVSAQLMERWIHSPAWVLPRNWKEGNQFDPRSVLPSHLDQRIVRMQWAKSNPHVKDAMDELRTKMANRPARELLRKRLANLHWGANNRLAFGSQQHSAIQLENSCQSNRVPFGGKLDTMDDMYGSLGLATLKVALIGEAVRDARSGRIVLQVTHTGFYIRDTYDFNGLQYLGTWTTSGVLSKAQMLMNSASDGLVFRSSGVPIGNVFNHHFDAYRRATGCGGDFVIYSDVLWQPANLLLELA
jgi:hypothetical protein